MQLSEGVEWAVHACVLLAAIPPEQVLPASRLAEFHEVPPAYLAKHLQALAAAGIVESVPGRKGGYRLARPAAEVTVLAVVQAIEGRAPAFRCTEIRQRGPGADDDAHYAAPCGIAAVMWDAEAAWRAVLAGTSMLDLALHAGRSATAVSIRRTVRWFQEVAR